MQATTKSLPYVDPEVKAMIVKQCVMNMVPPRKLAIMYHYSQQVIRNWVKEAGHKLPETYTKFVTAPSILPKVRYYFTIQGLS